MEHFHFHLSSKAIETAIQKLVTRTGHVATATVTVARASARVASNTVAVARTKTQVERAEGKKQRTPQDGKPDAFCALSSLKELPLGKAHGQLAAFLMPEKLGLHPPVLGLALFAYQKKLSIQKTSSTAYRS